MKYIAISAAALLLAPHSAIAEDATPRCGNPPAGWIGPGTAIAPVNNVFALDEKGAIVWNGSWISDPMATEFLTFAARIDPKPVLILRYADEVSCDRIAKMRALIERTYGCDTGAVCYEGGNTAP